MTTTQIEQLRKYSDQLGSIGQFLEDLENCAEDITEKEESATGSRKFRLYVKAHRLAFRLHHGRWPSAILDHVDGNPSNNRIDNLREATPSQSAYNRCLPSNNTSGHLGVMFNKREGRWIVVIGMEGKRVRCGVASSKMSAALAAPLIYREVAGEFARQSANEKGSK